ncbi:MAG: endonuclease/exonuclease/phosphatase family protein [Roseibacillus sp.]
MKPLHIPFQLLAILLLMAAGAQAAPLRVATFNIEGEFFNSQRQFSLTAPGTSDYDSIRDILARIDADVVCLQEVYPSDYDNGSSQHFASLASELGYSHTVLSTRSNSFDFQLRNAILSRYPFEDLEEIGSADYCDDRGLVGTNGSRAKELTRTQPAIVIDVPGAAKPTTIITLHNKALSSPVTDDKFRQAIELARMREYLLDSGLDNTDNIIILGDFNLGGSSVTFTAEPTTLPSTYNRGTDIPLPISYEEDPDFYFPTPFQMTALDARAVNNNDATTFSGSTLDFILATPAMTLLGSEIYRSTLDTSNAQGLTKAGDPLPSNTSAEASDHYAVFADFELEDDIPAPSSYSLTDAAPKISETFDSFTGTAPPALWTSSNSDWQGFYSNQTLQANYGFDSSGDRSVGLVASATPSTFSATFDNDTSGTIEGLDFSYLAQQFTANDPGTDDTFTASLTIAGGSPVSLPDLNFTADSSNSLPFSEGLSTTLQGLSIAPGSSFTLTLTATQGPDSGGPVSSEVFINEFHYDNTSTDTGEFVEVVVAPGFTTSGGNLAQIEVILYNGNSGQAPYDTIPLTDFDNFSAPTVSNGYQIFTHNVVLQNGPDGIAIANDGVVTQFISYEGTLDALAGPATGQQSVDIGEEQDPQFSAGVASIGLTGAGADSGSMSWTRFGNTVAHTPGQLNPGQTFTGSSPSASQAFSFDNVTVCIAAPPDNDMDGDPDSTDPDDDNDQLPDLLEALLGLDPLLADSDNNGTSDGDEDSDGDGQSNLAELLITLTDPADSGSSFTACLEEHPTNPNQLALIFPTLLGRNYQILSSQDPTALTLLANYTGTGNEFIFTIVPNQPQATFFAVGVSLAEE